MNNQFIIRLVRTVHLLVLLAPCMLFISCQRPARNVGKKATSNEKQSKTVQVGVVRERVLEKTINLPATIQSDETAQLMARVEAYVDKVLVNIGDEVPAGQVLVRLHAPEILQAADEYRARIHQLQANEKVMQAELSAARSQLGVAQSQLQLKQSQRDRRSRLVSTGAVAREMLEETEADVQSQEAMLAKYENAIEIVEAKLVQGQSEMAVGQAKLKQAQTMASYLEIKAPFAGVVAERNVDPGNLVRSSGQSGNTKPLLVLAKVDKLRALVHATTDVAGQLSVGQPIRFEADDVPDKVFEGRLSRMAGTYNQKTRMMQVEIDLDNAVDPATGQRPLRAGSYGSATIVLQAATLPVVPESVVRRRGDRTSVVVVRGGACLVTPVSIAFISNEMAAIDEGLQAGDQVVVEPDTVQDEQMVKESELEIENW